jgi:hypothetical protein
MNDDDDDDNNNNNNKFYSNGFKNKFSSISFVAFA